MRDFHCAGLIATRVREGLHSRKRIEKLRYMHRNPVKRGLVENRNIGNGAGPLDSVMTPP